MNLKKVRLYRGKKDINFQKKNNTIAKKEIGIFDGV